MNKNTNSLTTNSPITEEDKIMEKSTIYCAVKNAISNSINLASDTWLDELKAAIENHSILVTEKYWMESYAYAKKVLRPTPKTESLNLAIGYYSNTKAKSNEDLINDATIRLVNRFEYLVKKFYEHTCNSKSEEEAIMKFNGAVALIIPSMLTEKWRKVSRDVEFEELDSLTGKMIKKTGKGLRETHSAVSLNQNLASNDDDDEITLADHFIDKTDASPEEQHLMNEAIMDYISPLLDYPKKLQGFMCATTGISTDTIIALSSYITKTEVFTMVCSYFSRFTGVPEFMNLPKLYSEEDFTYTGVNLKKQYTNDRSAGKTIVKRYILDEQ